MKSKIWLYLRMYLLGVVGSACVVGYLLWQSHTQVIGQAAINSTNMAWIIADHIDATMRRAEAQLIQMSTKIPPEILTQASADQMQPIVGRELATLKERFPEVTNFFVLDRNGDSLYSSEPIRNKFNIAERKHFKRLRDDPAASLAFTEVVVSKTTGQLSLVMARALRDREGKFLGIISALINFDSFKSLFDDLDIGAHGLIALRQTDDHKLILRRPLLSGEYNQSITSPVTKRIDAGERSGVQRMTSPIDGISRTLSFRVLKDYPFSINVAIADDDTLSAWRRQVFYGVTATASVLLIIGFLLLRVWRIDQQRMSALDHLMQQEQSLRAAKDAAESANVAKSTFLASMSHELRTPLNAVLGYAQLLGMDDQEHLNVRESAGEIEKAGKHLLALVNDILDLARVESGKLDCHIEHVKLDNVLDNCLQIIKNRAQENNIRLHIPTTSATVLADHARLQQVLINLLSNAIKYNREGGEVSVEGTEQPESRYRIAITDTGLGLSPERMQDLFTPFNRLGAENSAIEGTGIGLVITKSLIELMHGSIGVTSTQGVGSTFWVELPMVIESS